MIVNGNKYVQIGWIQTNSVAGVNNGMHYFYEINYDYFNTGDFQIYTAGGPVAGSTHGYRVSLENNYWAGTVDGKQISQSALSSAYPNKLNDNMFLYSGTKIQISEEIASGTGNAQRSAVAGTSSDHARFSNVRAFFNGVTYYSPSATRILKDANAAQSLAHYGGTSIYPNQSDSYLQFWDARY